MRLGKRCLFVEIKGKMKFSFYAITFKTSMRDVRSEEENVVLFCIFLFFSTQKALFISLSSSLARLTAAREYLHITTIC